MHLSNFADLTNLLELTFLSESKTIYISKFLNLKSTRKLLIITRFSGILV